MSKEVVFSPFPKQKEFIESALSGEFTFIMYGGSIRSGKSFVAIATIILLCKMFPGSRWAVTRIDMPSIEKNLFPVFDKLLPLDFVKFDRRKSTTNPHIEFGNGSKILFFPENYSRDKELNRFKGLEVSGFYVDEINEIQEDTFNKMKERAGSYIIANTKKQPKPLILSTVNPTSNWVKRLIYEPWEKNVLNPKYKYIPANINDNIHLEQSYLDSLKDLPYYHYRIYVEGDWHFKRKTENAYWKAFDLDKHASTLPFDPNIPVHISVDSNVLPYCAISLWQMKTHKKVVQIGEIPAADPHNTAKAAAKLVNEYLVKLGHEDLIILHGDASAKAKNTIDPEKRSFIKLFQSVLEEEFIVKNRVANSNPSVSLRGEFINAVYSGLLNGYEININESCKDSINDYMSVLEDMNGGMQKRRITEKGLTFEPDGHFSDTKAYFLCDVWKSEYNKFKNAGSTHKYILNITKSKNSL